MAIGSLQFRLHPQEHARPLTAYSIVIDGTELVTSSVLQDDFEYLLSRHEQMAVPGMRLDVLFTGATPFSVSIVNRHGSLLLRISDSFDGGVLEEPVDFSVLKTALAAFVDEFLGRPGLDAAVRAALGEALERFRAWQGPSFKG